MPLALSHGLSFEDLYSREGVQQLDSIFVRFLSQADVDVHNRFVKARLKAMMLEKGIDKETESKLLVDLTPLVDEFLAALFDIKQSVTAVSDNIDELAPIYRAKRQFVQRKAMKQYKADDVQGWDGDALLADLEAKLGGPFSELAFASAVLDKVGEDEIFARYGAWASYTKAGYRRHIRGVLFKHPQKTDRQNLVPLETEEIGGITVLKQADDLRYRDGFQLTDSGCDMTFAMDQSAYCLKCHEREKDSCRTGIRDKESGGFVRDELGNDLVGCPLDQKISEMVMAAEKGHMLGALGIVCVDNPFVAATGHRICNECMKACIFQKQDPVDVPQIETRILKEVLALPWGFEIYSLLTRWNPFNLKQPLPLPPTDYNVLVVGMGPAGFTLAHYLLSQGHHVTGIDGLKIESLDVGFQPIKNMADHWESLDDRIMAGFGGVAEYGITVRWDKNFLKVIRLLLERRRRFQMHGGVRFGGTIKLDQAFDELGFDHVALCTGAGKPKILDIPNGLAKGVRAASDFLMALQLTGAAKKDSLANLQVRLPVVVVGGGLTAIDTATEALAYYPRQVETFAARYHRLCDIMGKESVRQRWTAEDAEIAEEFLTHAAALKGKSASERLDLLKEWGGVTVAYRKTLQDAPSYRLNHEEVIKAFEEGIHLVENADPVGVDVDSSGAAIALETSVGTLPARTILIAAGTEPNTVAGREESDKIHLDGRFFQVMDFDGTVVSPELIPKPKDVHLINYMRDDKKAVTYFGDLHPSFHGKVVKAMASAKLGAPIVGQILAMAKPLNQPQDLHDMLTPTVVSVEDKEGVYALTVRAPLAAQNYQPGHFYRLQAYEQTAPTMEGVAITPVHVDKINGEISTVVRKTGGSADRIKHMQPGDRVLLMGPTGTALKIPHNQHIILLGEGYSVAALSQTAAQAKAQGCTVTVCKDTDTASQNMQGADMLVTMGSPRFLLGVQSLYQQEWAAQMAPSHIAKVAVHAPMQCMMKEVCAQCIQHRINPETGKKEVYFTCFNPLQDLQAVDLATLKLRLGQNSLAEKIAALR